MTHWYTNMPVHGYASSRICRFTLTATVLPGHINLLTLTEPRGTDDANPNQETG